MRRTLVVVLFLGCGPTDLVYDGGPRRGWLDGALDGAVDAGADASAPRYGDTCGAAVVAIETSVADLPVDTEGFANDEALGCGIAATRGNDVYVALDARAGELWHVHVDPTDDEARPVLFVLDDTCTRCIDAVNHCAQLRGEEHLTFRAEQAGRYWVGIDDQEPGAEEWFFSAQRLVCGDRYTHGEGCDDGNTEDGDGCDHLCRAEITTEEDEPNEDPYRANVVLFDATEARIIHGDLGGLEVCSTPDYFVIAPEAPRTVELRFVDPDGTSCDGSILPAREVDVLSSDGSTLATGAPDASGCVSLTVAVPAGEHWIRVRPRESSEEVFDYALSVRLTP